MGGWGSGEKLVPSKLKLDPRPAIEWPGADSAVPVDIRVASTFSCRRWLSAGHTVAVDVVVIVAAVAREKKVIMALSTKTIDATAFITSSTGCCGLSPGDGARFTVRTFPRIPKVKTNVLKHAHIWVERTTGVAVLLSWESFAGTMQASAKSSESQRSVAR